jgi:hypothetical protein
LGPHGPGYGFLAERSPFGTFLTDAEAQSLTNIEQPCFHKDEEILEGEDVPPDGKVVHHDVRCTTCDKISRQFHLIKGDTEKKEYVCQPKCPFHLGR